MSYKTRSGRVCAIVIVMSGLAGFAGAQGRVDPRSRPFDARVTRTFDRAFVAPSVQAYLSINTRNDKINICEPTMVVFANADMTYYGTWTYKWTLYRNGQVVGTPKEQVISCSEDDLYCEPPAYSLAAASVSGTYQIMLQTYQIKLDALTGKTLSNVVNVTAAPPCPPKEKGNLLHVAALTTDGKLWHSIRYATEFTWQPLQNVWLPAIDRWGIPGRIVDVSVATLDNELHVAVVNDTGKIFHAIRYPFKWQPFREINVHTGSPATFVKVAVAEVSRELHVTAMTADGGLWHTIRHANSWDKFSDVLQHTGSLGKLKALDVASVRGELHVLVLNEAGRVWHTIRHTNSWDKFGDVQYHTGTPGAFKTISGAAVAGELHVVGVTVDGKIWHTIRHPYSWDKFGDVQYHTGTPGIFDRVSVGQSGNELHVMAVTTTGGLYHTIRHASSWDKFGDVEKSNAGERGSFTLLSADGAYIP